MSARRIRVPKWFLSTALLAGVTLIAGVLVAAPGLAASDPAATSTGSTSPTGTLSPTPSGPLTTPTRPTTSVPESLTPTSISPTTSCPPGPTLPVDPPGRPLRTDDFENGTVQGWSGSGGAAVANSTEVAEGGSHSLRVDGLTASGSARTMVSGFGTFGWYKVTAKVRIGGNGPATRIALRPMYDAQSIPGSAVVTGSGWTTLTAYLRPSTLYWDTFCGPTPGGQLPAAAGLSLMVDQTTCGPATGPLASTVFLDSVKVISVYYDSLPPGVTPTPGATGGPTPTPTSSSCPTPPITTTPPSGTCAVHYVDNNRWPGAHLVTVTIDNLTTVDKPTWTLSWDFGDDEKITNLWSASYEQTGRHVTLHSLPYSPLRAKSSVTFGFIATDPGGLTRPGNVLLDGQTCTLA